jgi:hypothetical protein
METKNNLRKERQIAELNTLESQLFNIETMFVSSPLHGKDLTYPQFKKEYYKLSNTKGPSYLTHNFNNN